MTKSRQLPNSMWWLTILYALNFLIYFLLEKKAASGCTDVTSRGATRNRAGKTSNLKRHELPYLTLRHASGSEAKKG